LLLSIVATAECLGISRAHFYEIIALSKIATVRLGRRRMVRSSDLSAYVNQLDDAPL
jgi:excisionase family DNA binding protein